MMESSYIKISKECDRPFFVIVRDRPLGISEMDGQRHRVYAQARTRLVEEHVPFFTAVAQAARAVKELINYYRRKG